jgi:hypothetical protein
VEEQPDCLRHLLPEAGGDPVRLAAFLYGLLAAALTVGVAVGMWGAPP